MVVRHDIGKDEVALHLRDGKYITGYTTVGGYDNDSGQVKVKREILPPYFFDEFSSDKYLYYEKPEEVIVNKDFVSPVYSDEGEVIPEVKEETVSKEEYDKLKAEMDEIRRLLEQLMKQKG